MKNVRPCPYCNGEVEVIKLNKKKGETESLYRLQCMRCKMTVARGLKFDKETIAQGEERIKQYEEYIANSLKRASLPLYKGHHKASGMDLKISSAAR